MMLECIVRAHADIVQSFSSGGFHEDSLLYINPPVSVLDRIRRNENEIK